MSEKKTHDTSKKQNKTTTKKLGVKLKGKNTSCESRLVSETSTRDSLEAPRDSGVQFQLQNTFKEVVSLKQKVSKTNGVKINKSKE
jgi:hypothetical protein